MINFFLLAWDSTNPHHAATAERLIHIVEDTDENWEKVFHANGIATYAQAPTKRNIFQIENNRGIILGRLFRKTCSIDDDTSVSNLSADEAQKIHKSHGNYLTDRFWGSYVSILPTSEKEILIGRDCSGLQLCYHTWHNDIFIAFSNFDSLPFLKSIKKDINWNYLATTAKYGISPLIETGIKHVQQLAAGQYAQITLSSKEVKKIRSWKPESFTTNPIEDHATAQNTLYTTTLCSVKAQSKYFNNIHLMLSGGFDSSVLLACLRNTWPTAAIYAKHYHSLENDVSEEHYARCIADAYNVEIEIERTQAKVNNNYISNTTPPWPIPVDRDRPDADKQAKILEYHCEKNIDGIFKGQGGDQIFFKKPQLAPLFDYKKKHLFDTRYYSILLNTAHLTEFSIWKLLQIQKLNDHTANAEHHMGNIFLSKDISDELPPPNVFETHPWFQTNEMYSFGKLNQLKQFTFFNHYAQRYTPSTPDIPAISPFICQPLMEIALRIPTYTLLANGRNRGLAREAFKKELVPEIYNRERKGYVTKYSHNMIIENLNSIKSFLYDGILVKENFVDKKLLDKEFNENSIKTKTTGSYISNIVKYEKWARSLL